MKRIKQADLAFREKGYIAQQTLGRHSQVKLGSIGADIAPVITRDCAKWLLREAERLPATNGSKPSVAAFIALLVNDAWNDELEAKQ